MRSIRVLLALFIALQIFSTPLLAQCDMSVSSEYTCCMVESDCECDSDLPQKIDAVKHQVKTVSYDFNFEYSFNCVLQEIIYLEEYETQTSVFYHPTTPSFSSREYRAKLQVYII